MQNIYSDPDGAKGREGGTVRLETGTIRGTSSVDRPPFAPSARGDYEARLFLGSHSPIRRHATLNHLPVRPLPCRLARHRGGSGGGANNQRCTREGASIAEQSNGVAGMASLPVTASTLFCRLRPQSLQDTSHVVSDGQRMWRFTSLIDIDRKFCVTELLLKFSNISGFANRFA